MLHWQAEMRRPLSQREPRPPAGRHDPATRDITETSGQRIGVPGTVVGMSAAAERFGTRPWAVILRPGDRRRRGRVPDVLLPLRRDGRGLQPPDLLPLGPRAVYPGRLPAARSVRSGTAEARRDAAPDRGTGRRGVVPAGRVRRAFRCGGARDRRHDDAGGHGGYTTRWDEPTRFRFRGHDFSARRPPTPAARMSASRSASSTDSTSPRLGDWAHRRARWRPSPACSRWPMTRSGRYCPTRWAFDLPLDTDPLLGRTSRMQARILETQLPARRSDAAQEGRPGDRSPPREPIRRRPTATRS